MVGFTNYLGDLQTNNIEIGELKVIYGAFARFGFGRTVALKGFYHQGKISGSDLNSIAPELRRRNLNFQTDLHALGSQLEITFSHFGERRKSIASSYFFGGVTQMFFNPKTKYQDQWVELRELGTEGQGMEGMKPKYALNTLTFPLGLGMKVNFTRMTSLGFEAGIHLSQTDYLDDVSGDYPNLLLLSAHNPLAATLSYREPEYDDEASATPNSLQRGNPKDKDMIVFVELNFSVYLFRPLR